MRKNWGRNNKKISKEDIALAKSVPIEQYFEEIIEVELSSYYSSNPVDFNSKQNALCPLHTEKTGSFKLFSNNTFHCWGCGGNGDIIALHIKFMDVHFNQEVGFVEAVKFLIDKFIEGREINVVKKQLKMVKAVEIENSRNDLMRFSAYIYGINERAKMKGEFNIDIEYEVDNMSKLVKNGEIAVDEAINSIKRRETE